MEGLNTKRIAILVALCLGIAGANSAISLSKADLSSMQNQLSAIKKSSETTGKLKKDLEQLMKKAERIASLNDKCGSISINDVLDPECQKYKEELPDFRSEFMRVTGEIRLNNMDKILEKAQDEESLITTCSEAFSQFFISPEQLTSIRMNSDLDIEPQNRNNDYLVNYDFSITYDKKRLRIIQRNAELWVNSCRKHVLKKGRLAALFANDVRSMNDTTSADAFVDTDRTKLTFHDAGKTMGVYTLGGTELFNTKQKTLGNYLIIDLDPEEIPAEFDENVSLDYQDNVTLRLNKNRQLEGGLEWIRVEDYGYSSNSEYSYDYGSSEDDYSSSSYNYYEEESSSSYSYNYSYDDESSSSSYSYSYDYSENDYSSSSSYDNYDSDSHSKPGNVRVRFSAIGGMIISFPTFSDEFKEKHREVSYTEEGGSNQVYYGLGQLYVDIGKFTLGVGAGVATLNVTTDNGVNLMNEPVYDNFGNLIGEEPVSTIKPMASIEIGYVTEIHTKWEEKLLSRYNASIGIRGSYILDSEYSQTHVGLYAELGIFGFELGRESIESLWSSSFCGLYIRFPTKSMIDYWFGD